jgi:hypothetical protein
MERQIILPITKEVIVQREIKVELTEVTLLSVEDNGSSVIAHFKRNDLCVLKPLVLWEGEAYIEIGNWTDEDVENRIKELL